MENKKFSKVLLVAIISMVLLPMVQANISWLIFLTQNKDQIDSYFESGRIKEETRELINSNSENLPPEVLSIFVDNKLNIHIEFDDGSIQEYYAVTQEGKILQLLQGSSEEADNEIIVKESTVDRIVESGDPITELINAMNAGEIKYNGLTLGGMVKSSVVGFGSFIAGIIGFFVGLFG